MSHAHTTFEAPLRRRSNDPASSGMRARLRAATTAAHERMHAHPGFAAAAAGTIGFADYRRLLARLYGFHRPFEAAACEAVASTGFDFDIEGRARSPALVADLKTLGLDPEAIARLPLWTQSFSFASEAALLGALYVLEGSTLGGVQIARALQGVVGDKAGDGRRFFLGRGDQRSSMWRDFLAQLESLSEDAKSSREAIDSAVATFEDFEAWMTGWEDAAASVPQL
jgi:heme oxygenase (biliverdin-IX-beta and delta-forming)